MAAERPWFGEEACHAPQRRGSAERCQNAAKWWDARPLCAVHCAQAKHPRREPLEKNPNAAALREAGAAEHATSIVELAEANCAAGRRGRVAMVAMRMRRATPSQPGWLQVFPNRRGATPALSPMVLPYRGREERLFWVRGPAGVWRPANRDDFPDPTGAPPASVWADGGERECKLERMPDVATIESAHQQAKLFAFEQHGAGGWPADSFWTNYLREAPSVDPKRHKYPKAFIKTHASAEAIANNNYNIPEYACRADRHGRWRRFTYVESRYFYASAYAQEASQTEAFCRLRDLLRDGANLQICGYDAWPVARPLYDHYCDASRPFGHEACLLVLLTVDDPRQYPWERYANSHPEVYEGFRD